MKAFAAAAAIVVLTASGSWAAAPSLYTSAQAAAGQRAYESNCASCHGARLEGGAGPALAGANLVKLHTRTRLTVGDVFAFTVHQMPLGAPSSLPRETYVDIMAYILHVNGYPIGAKPLSYDAAMKSTAIMTSHPR